jgi:hypothetical protein
MDLTIEQYVNIVLERIYDDDTAFGHLNSYFILVDRANEERAEVLSDMVYKYLSSIYGDKIPRDIFRQKCLEREIRPEEIVMAEMKYKQCLEHK